jgi:hypothetical protein
MATASLQNEKGTELMIRSTRSGRTAILRMSAILAVGTISLIGSTATATASERQTVQAPTAAAQSGCTYAVNYGTETVTGKCTSGTGQYVAAAYCEQRYIPGVPPHNYVRYGNVVSVPNFSTARCYNGDQIKSGSLFPR